jgi:hypothetical protein
VNGIALWDGASGTVRDNRITSSDTGIAIGAASAQIDGNVVAGSWGALQGLGIAVDERADVDIVANVIRGEGATGFRIAGGSAARIIQNSADERRVGVVITGEDTDAVVEDNTITRAADVGVEIAGGAHATVARNAIGDAQNAAIQVHARSRAEITDNVLTGPVPMVRHAPVPNGIAFLRQASGAARGNTISGFRNLSEEQPACGVLVAPDVMDVTIGANTFPPPGNELDICDARTDSAAATPAA